MQRFRFRLASVLSWRALQLEVEETKFRALFAERARIEAEIIQLGENRREADRMLTADSVEGQELAALDAHRHALARAVERLRASSADCERRIAQQRAKVVEAERHVRLLERLKERRLAEWQIESDRELETLASEAFLARWVRER
jgi:flagellar export protein FliJ